MRMYKINFDAYNCDSALVWARDPKHLLEVMQDMAEGQHPMDLVSSVEEISLSPPIEGTSGYFVHGKIVEFNFA